MNLVNHLLIELGIATLADTHMKIDTARADYLRGLPILLMIGSRGILLPVLEELFFRGFLLAALLRVMRPRNAIFASALFFGLFHLVDMQIVSLERAVISTLLGLLLGWLTWCSGSVVPGMIVHALHDSCLWLLFYFQPHLIQGGWLSRDQQQLPPFWILTAGGCTLGALIWVAWAGRNAPNAEASNG
jgi:ABC-2 type transport system permease protein/sodium transport system permease protein